MKQTLFALLILLSTASFAQQVEAPKDTIPRDTIPVSLVPSGTYDRFFQYELQKEKLRGEIKAAQSKIDGLTITADELVLLEIKLSPYLKDRKVVRYYYNGSTVMVLVEKKVASAIKKK